jgi:hypothetical protein
LRHSYVKLTIFEGKVQHIANPERDPPAEPTPSCQCFRLGYEILCDVYPDDIAAESLREVDCARPFPQAMSMTLVPSPILQDSASLRVASNPPGWTTVIPTCLAMKSKMSQVSGSHFSEPKLVIAPTHARNNPYRWGLIRMLVLCC